MYTYLTSIESMEPQFDKEIRVKLTKFWDDDLTNEEISEATGIHKNTISKYKNGASLVAISNLWKIAKFLGARQNREISMEDLLQIVNAESLTDK